MKPAQIAKWWCAERWYRRRSQYAMEIQWQMETDVLEDGPGDQNPCGSWRQEASAPVVCRCCSKGAKRKILTINWASASRHRTSIYIRSSDEGEYRVCHEWGIPKPGAQLPWLCRLIFSRMFRAQERCFRNPKVNLPICQFPWLAQEPTGANSALCAAITGMVPSMGFHWELQGGNLVDVQADVKTDLTATSDSRLKVSGKI